MKSLIEQMSVLIRVSDKSRQEHCLALIQFLVAKNFDSVCFLGVAETRQKWTVFLGIYA